MYNAKYVIKKDSRDKTNTHSYVLKAKFGFFKHLSRYWSKSIEKDWDRVNNMMELKNAGSRLSQYLIREEKLDYHKKQGANSHLFVDDFREVKLTQSCLERFFLGFHLKVHAKGNLPLEKIFDLKALDEFVLTGEK